MDAISSAIINHAVASSQANVQLAASTAMLKQSLQLQAANAAMLLQAVSPPPQAASATLGTRVDTWA
jgi:hypothetical protein